MKKYEAPDMLLYDYLLTDIVTTSEEPASGEDEGEMPADWGSYLDGDFSR